MPAAPAILSSISTFRTDIYTYFTKPTGITQLLYSANDWTEVVLRLDTAGPVAYGTAEDLAPTTSGRGNLLLTGNEARFIMAPANRLFIIADTVNRLNLTFFPVPWLAQITAGLEVLIMLAATGFKPTDILGTGRITATPSKVGF